MNSKIRFKISVFLLLIFVITLYSCSKKTNFIPTKNDIIWNNFSFDQKIIIDTSCKSNYIIESKNELKLKSKIHSLQTIIEKKIYKNFHSKVRNNLKKQKIEIIPYSYSNETTIILAFIASLIILFLLGVYFYGNTVPIIKILAVSILLGLLIALAYLIDLLLKESIRNLFDSLNLFG